MTATGRYVIWLLCSIATVAVDAEGNELRSCSVGNMLLVNIRSVRVRG